MNPDQTFIPVLLRTVYYVQEPEHSVLCGPQLGLSQSSCALLARARAVYL